MKRTLLAIAMFGLFLIAHSYGQVSGVKYQMKYNPVTCKYDCYIVIITGTSTTAPQRAQFNSQYSIVVPTGSTLSVAQNFNPIQGNNSGTNTTPPLQWTISSNINAPAVTPLVDYYSITPTLSPTSFYAPLSPGMEVKLFSLTISPTVNCSEGIRIYENPVIVNGVRVSGDPSSSEPGMGGGDFANGFTIGGIQQDYISNLPKVLPPQPVLSAVPACSLGLEIDLTATTSNTCQAPLTYAWIGPNNFTSTSQDVKITNATSASNGNYQVIVSDKLGCKDTLDVQAFAKPVAGPNIQTCSGSSATLTAIDPLSGTWSTAVNNPLPTGSAILVGNVATFDQSANGNFNFIYSANSCNDTLTVSVTDSNAGPDPSAVLCFANGSATINAVGTGTWSLAQNSSGTATIANPNSASTNVSSFSVAGNYFFIWTTNGCKDTVMVVVGDNCSCPVTNNIVNDVNPSTYCGTSGVLTIIGNAATPAGTYLWQYSLNNGTFADAAGTNSLQNYTTVNLSTGVHKFRRLYTIPACTDTSNVVTITVISKPAIPSNLTAIPNPVCLGNAVSLSVTNNPGAIYAWAVSSPNAGSTSSITSTASLTPISVGTYTVSVTQTVNGCTSDPATVSLVVDDTPPTPSGLTSSNPTTCNGSQGTITFSGLKNNSTYTINYKKNNVSTSGSITTNGNGTGILSGLGAGSYTDFSISAASGCTSGIFNGPISLVDPTAPSAPSNLQAIPNPACLGTTVNLSVTNNPGATYNWSASDVQAGLGSSTTNSNSMLATASGFYTISVTQTVNGCTSIPVNVGVGINPAPATPSAGTVTSTNPGVCAGSNGTISISGQLANTAITITYNKNGIPATANVTTNGSGVAIITGLTAGSYTNFKIINFNNCSSGTFAGPVNLSDPNPPNPPANMTANPNPACIGTVVNLSVTNNAGAVYVWSAPANAGIGNSTTNANVMNATAAGTYVISVTQNVAGCVSLPSTVSVVINSTPPTPTGASLTATNPTSCGGNQGTLKFTGLQANTSFVINYAKNGVPTSATITSDATGTATITGITAGSYTNFKVTAGTCASGVFAGPITVTDPATPPTPDVSALPNPSCIGQTVSLSVNNPANGASFVWSASSPNAGLATSTTAINTLKSTSAGVYTISVTQSVNGCTSLPGTVTIDALSGVPTPSVSSITVQNPTACATSTGSISLNGLTANTPYTINYSKNGNPTSASVTTNGSGVAVIANLSAGNYTNFSIVPVTGCPSGVYAGPVNLVDPGAPGAPANLTAIPNPLCLGLTSNLSVTNNPGAVYTWSASSVNAGLVITTINSTTMTPTAVGSYTISVFQNVAGCISPSASITVDVLPTPPTPSANSVSSTNPTSCGLNNGSIAISGLLSSTNYTINYKKDNGTSSVTVTTTSGGLAIINNLGGGSYTDFVIVGAGNCNSGPYAGPVVISSPPSPNPPSNLVAIPNPVCVGTTVNLSVDNNPLATYTWSASSSSAGLAASTTNTTTLNTLTAGSYTISVTQTVAGCTSPPSTVVVTVNKTDPPTNPFANPTPACLGEQINLRVDEGNQASCKWTISPLNAGFTSGNGNTATFMATTTGTFMVSITQVMNGCESAPIALPVVVNNCQNASIGDFVWNDANANGIQNSGESGIPNVKVELFRDDNILYATTTTSSVGKYEFLNVLPGNYFLKFGNVKIGANDLVPTFKKVGTNNTVDSDIDGSGKTEVFSVFAGVDNNDLDAGYYICSKIGDLVWYDANKNDVWDSNENGIDGLQVKLYRNTNGTWSLFDQTLTGHKPGTPSDDGYFSFCAPPGTYYIEIVTPPSGLVTARPNIGGNAFKDSDITGANGKGTTNTFTLASGQNKLDIGAGYYPQAIAGNLVWLDENSDGLQNNNETKVEGVKVQAYDASTNDLLGEAVSNAQGVYRIDKLEKKDVYFKFSPPSGLGATLYNPADDKMNSDVDHTYGLNTTRAISMQPGVENINIDLGLSFGALPLNWEKINVWRKNDTHIIEWATSKEINVDYFLVERISPNENNYKEVSAKIRANGISSVLNEYLFEDKEVSDVGIYYYRIKQVDFDGRSAYSSEVSIKHSTEDFAIVYPNPVMQNLTIELNLNDEAEVEVKVFTMQGQLLREYGEKAVLNKGQNKIPLDVHQLPAGVYNVMIEYNGIIIKKEVIRG